MFELQKRSTKNNFRQEQKEKTVPAERAALNSLRAPGPAPDGGNQK
jgi:hypothetical protein